MSQESLELMSQLRHLELDPNINQRQITYIRGRLIRQLNIDIRNNTDPVQANILRNALSSEFNVHQQQLNSRIAYATHGGHNIVAQVAQETGLKTTKIANNVRAIVSNTDGNVKAANGAAVVGNLVSTTFSIAKLPIVATLRLTSLALPIAGTLIVQPLHIFGLPFSMLINPNHQYNGAVINNFGRHFGEAIATVVTMAENGIRRI